MLNNLPQPTYYNQGRHRLDYSLTTGTVLQSVSGCGILAANDGVISDHTLQFVNFRSNELFGRHAPSIVPFHQREFHYENSMKRSQFIEELHRIHKHQDVVTRVNALQDKFLQQGVSDALVTEYNSLDYEMSCSIKAAAKNVSQKKFGYQRSKMLTDDGSKYLLWKAAYSCKCRKIRPKSGNSFINTQLACQPPHDH